MDSDDKDRLFAVCLAEALLGKARDVMPLFDKAPPAIKKRAETAMTSLEDTLRSDQRRILRELL